MISFKCFLIKKKKKKGGGVVESRAGCVCVCEPEGMLLIWCRDGLFQSSCKRRR